MTIEQVSVPLAFAAGLVSFLSPCVLPLVPAYLAYLAGPATHTAGAGGGGGGSSQVAERRDATVNTIAFIGGLSLVFVVFFYVLRTALEPFRAVVGPVAGVLVILIGLHTAGVLRLPLVDRELRFLKRAPAPSGPGGALLLGIGFAAGWTPCIGATLGAVLTSGITTGTTGAGLVLLAAYCLGLGVPFLVMGLGLEHAVAATRALRRHQATINLASGAILVAMGALLVTGNLILLTQGLSRLLPSAPPFGL